VLGTRVSLAGSTVIGADNVIGDGCVLGAVPQDLKYHGRECYLIIGDRNRLGPNVTAHIGTELGGWLTRIGHDNVIESGTHVAHDCFVQDRAHLGFGVLLAGHIRVDDGAVLEAMLGVTHFTTIGCYSRVGARTPVVRDVPPFTAFSSNGYYSDHAAVQGLHEEGLAKAGLNAAEADAVRKAFAELYGDEQPLAPKVDRMLSGPLPPAARELCSFLQRSLQARFGRFREALRGEMPPEARAYLPQDVLGRIESEKKP
jgi:UDP-N-acetylglucosamine acyltransferase